MVKFESDSPKLRRTWRFLVISLFILLTHPLWAHENEGSTASGILSFLTSPKFWLSMIFGLTGLGLMAGARISRRLRFILLALIVFVFSIIAILPLGSFAQAMGIHPSPVCNISRPFKFIKIIY